MRPGEISQGTDRLVLAPAERREAVLQLMRSAERGLLLSMFRCDDFRIIDEVAAAARRGVHVRVLITQRARGWRDRLKDLTALLQSLGADVRPYESPVMKYHAKYIVADDSRALVTSLNFTRKCFESTCDFMVLSDDPDVVSGLKTLFETDCRTPVGRLPDITRRLIIGPEHSRRRLTEMLSAARGSVRIVDHRLTDPQILALLTEKERKNIPVQVIGNGLIGGLICHGRMILIDEKTAIIGSIHLSPPSLDARREVAIVIEDPSLVAQLYDYFGNLATETKMCFWAAPLAAPEDDNDEEDE